MGTRRASSPSACDTGATPRPYLGPVQLFERTPAPEVRTRARAGPKILRRIRIVAVRVLR